MNLDKIAFSKVEAAQATSLSKRTSEELIKKGNLKASKIGARAVTPRSELVRIADANMSKA